MADVLNADDVEYLVTRLERVIDLLNAGQTHMAVAKLLADISALRNSKPRTAKPKGKRKASNK